MLLPPCRYTLLSTMEIEQREPGEPETDKVILSPGRADFSLKFNAT